MKIEITEEMQEALALLHRAREAISTCGLSCRALGEARSMLAQAESRLARLVAAAVEKKESK